MSEKELDKLINAIELKSKPADFPIKLVAIDGRGGAGKTTLASKLSKLLNAEIIHTDDFDSWQDALSWVPKLKQLIIEPIIYGAKDLNYQPNSWGPDHHPMPVENQPITPIMIIEGVASSCKELRPYLTYTAWIDTPKEISLKRGIARDQDSGTGNREQWLKWMAKEDAYIERDKPQDYADITVHGY